MATSVCHPCRLPQAMRHIWNSWSGLDCIFFDDWLSGFVKFKLFFFSVVKIHTLYELPSEIAGMPRPIAVETYDSHLQINILKSHYDLWDLDVDDGKTRGPSHDCVYLAFVTPTSGHFCLALRISRPGATPSRFLDHPGGTTCRMEQGKDRIENDWCVHLLKCSLSKPMSTQVIAQISEQVQIRRMLPQLAPCRLLVITFHPDYHQEGRCVTTCHRQNTLRNRNILHRKM